jgi:hypothetical protein
VVIARVPIDITWSGATGSPGVNVWHSRWDGNLSGSEQMAGLLEDLQTFYSGLANFYTTDTTVSFRGEIAGLGQDTGDSATYDEWTVTGTNTSGHAPPVDQVLISWQTGSGGRRGRGRTFLGPYGNGIVGDDGQLLPATQASIQGLVDTLVGESDDTGNGAWGVYSRADDLVRDFRSGTVRRPISVLRSRRD